MFKIKNQERLLYRNIIINNGRNGLRLKHS